jgi:hypothetical protein
VLLVRKEAGRKQAGNGMAKRKDASCTRCEEAEGKIDSIPERRK